MTVCFHPVSPRSVLILSFHLNVVQRTMKPSFNVSCVSFSFTESRSIPVLRIHHVRFSSVQCSNSLLFKEILNGDFTVVYSLQVFFHFFLCVSYLSYACYMPWSSHPSSFDRSDKSTNYEVFSAFCHFLLFRSKYSLEQMAGGMKLTPHLHLVPRSRMLELYFHSLICLHGIVLN
jgi:hypothetical protein